MDTHGSQGTWVTYEENRNDFSTKSSVDEYNGRKDIYKDSPNPIKSQADIFLTEIEKQLEDTESKYESVVERLRYTKMLYSNAAGAMSLETNDFDRTDDHSPVTEGNSQSDTSSNANLIDDKTSETNLSSSGIPQYLTETKHTQQKAQEDPDSKNQLIEPNSTSFKPESNLNNFHNIHDEDRNDTNDQSYLFERTKESKINFQFTKDTMENSVLDTVNQIHGEHFVSDNSSRRVHPYQLHLAEYSKGLHEQWEEESRIAESSMIENHDIYSNQLNCGKQQETKMPELHPNLIESLRSIRTSMKNKKPRHDRGRKTVSSKIVSKSIDDTNGTTTKRKKIKKQGGLKTSASRCTTATKDTSISENKKEIRRRPKQRGHSTTSKLQQSQNRRQHNVIEKHRNNMSEVVEIYHNSAIKSGSLSVVSSKHSKVMETRIRSFNNGAKLDQPWRTKGSHRLVENNGKRIFNEIEEQKPKEQHNSELNQSKDNCGNEAKSYQDNLTEPSDFRFGEPNRINDEANFLVGQAENKILKEYRNNDNQEVLQDCQIPHILSPSYDPFPTRNYESPTVSSRMKRVQRSYFNRFNFRNIPFVVGTSVTPSYNLGLNIQEALSLMKTRQLMPSRISPMIISSVSKGLKPVSTLFECIRDERESLMEGRNIPLSINSRGITSMYQGTLSDDKSSKPVQLEPFSSKTRGLSFVPDPETLYEVQGSYPSQKSELTPKKQKTQSICSSIKFNDQKHLERKLELTQSILLKQRQEELNIGESAPAKFQTVTQGSKGIREVLMNFHDQYETMIIKFEKLQKESNKSSDKSLEKELIALEKELNAKEEEIKAVASLYQEVMILKRQMRMLHERNSLVCVSTEVPVSPTYRSFSIRAQTANPIRMFNDYRRGDSVCNQGPPTSTKLAGMLRQIKTFQKQLKSNT
ncbi:uncharacterized protein [Venturia canescens]|uniref:uncharacterized protein isoform X2 n=1 Tax=Venturia canescens TaxID=32260 RepID=UPI001C9BF117|nr:uncharacterized protein LOC122406771 isoform X2 [Venturia canescens]